jgi:hypothetical protein
MGGRRYLPVEESPKRKIDSSREPGGLSNQPEARNAKRKDLTSTILAL